MKRRRCLAVLMCAVMVLMLAACGSGDSKVQQTEKVQQAEADRIRIGLTFDTFVLERWTRDRDVFVDTAQKLGATVDVQTANGDVEKQKEQIRKFTDENVDAIVIVATDCYKLTEEVRQARQKGIKVVSYDRLIQGVETDLYITVDNRKVGEEMALNIKERLPQGGSVVMICGPEADSNSVDVVSGFVQELGSGPWNIVYKSNVKSWTAENGTQAVNEAFENTTGPIDAIMCGNDGLAGYVIRALSEQQLAGKVVVVGQDADLEACQRIVEGTQSMTVYKPISELAKEAAECTVDLVKQGKMEDVTEEINNEDGYAIPYLGLEPLAVTAQNMEEVIISSGFHMKDEVYLNVEQEQ